MLFFAALLAPYRRRNHRLTRRYGCVSAVIADCALVLFYRVSLPLSLPLSYSLFTRIYALFVSICSSPPDPPPTAHHLPHSIEWPKMNMLWGQLSALASTFFSCCERMQIVFVFSGRSLSDEKQRSDLSPTAGGAIPAPPPRAYGVSSRVIEHDFFFFLIFAFVSGDDTQQQLRKERARKPTRTLADQKLSHASILKFFVRFICMCVFYHVCPPSKKNRPSVGPANAKESRQPQTPTGGEGAKRTAALDVRES